MAGVKGKSGGARKGAGRKKLPVEKLNLENPISVDQVTSEIKPSAIKDMEQVIDVMQVCDMNNLVCPTEFDTMPYAKRAWEYVLELDKHSRFHLLNERHFESIKSYCLAVEIRQNLIAEWERQGKASTILSGKGELKVNPIIAEISKQSNFISAYANDLGLTVMSEFKMAREVKSSPKLSKNDTTDEEENDDDLFE